MNTLAIQDMIGDRNTSPTSFEDNGDMNRSSTSFEDKITNVNAITIAIGFETKNGVCLGDDYERMQHEQQLRQHNDSIILFLDERILNRFSRQQQQQL